MLELVHAALEEHALGADLPDEDRGDAVGAAARSLVVRERRGRLQHGQQLQAGLLYRAVDVVVLAELLVHLERAELLLEREVPRLAVAVHRGVLDDVGRVVPEYVRGAVSLQRLPAEVELATPIRVVLDPEAVSDEKLQIRSLCIVNAELLTRHDVACGDKPQSILCQCCRPHACHHVVVQEVCQRNEHGALACALEGEAASLHNAQRPSQVFVADLPPTPRTWWYLVCCFSHALKVTKPVFHQIGEECRVDQLELPRGEPQDVGERHRQQPDPIRQDGVGIHPLQRQTQRQRGMRVAGMPPGRLCQGRRHALQRVDLRRRHAQHSRASRQRSRGDRTCSSTRDVADVKVDSSSPTNHISHKISTAEVELDALLCLCTAFVISVDMVPAERVALGARGAAADLGRPAAHPAVRRGHRPGPAGRGGEDQPPDATSLAPAATRAA
mmetsp:Transcript_108276/g.316712  ORF Transcript_108276/g.316712 Transcript_108276/m.316712 type:complete len:443 (-) Transcript_108276:107-1435(-)